jgi:hypothetical protein
MVYSYADLKNRIKVGDRVRAVAGKENWFTKTMNDSEWHKVTMVDGEGFSVDDCYTKDVLWDSLALESPTFYHDYFDLEPSVKTLATLREGDQVTNGTVHDPGTTRTVLGVCGRVYLMSEPHDVEMYACGFTAHDLADRGYRPVQPPVEKPETVDVLGRTYRKADVEDALRNVAAVN